MMPFEEAHMGKGGSGGKGGGGGGRGKGERRRRARRRLAEHHGQPVWGRKRQRAGAVMAGAKSQPPPATILDQVRDLYGGVSAESVSEELVRAAKDIGDPPLKGCIGIFICESNSCRLALAMASQDPTSEIRVVGGLAFPFGVGFPEPDVPRAHVWVRQGEKHLDITWPLRGPIAAAKYHPILELSVPELGGSYAPGLLRSIWTIAEQHGIRYL
jgi:hypothetical protein